MRSIWLFCLVLHHGSTIRLHSHDPQAIVDVREGIGQLPELQLHAHPAAGVSQPDLSSKMAAAEVLLPLNFPTSRQEHHIP